MELGDSLELTPTWAVAIVVIGLILISLGIEHLLHLLSHFLHKRKRKTLIQALEDVEAELRSLGFMSLLLTIASQPISKICIPRRLVNSFLPCKRSDEPIFDEAKSCEAKGMVSLVSEVGVNQLQLLIFTLAVFHVLSCIVTLGLGEVKMKKWKYWEEETRTMEYQLSNDPRRLTLSRETSFGRRHLKLWSSHHLLLWLVCCIRQFTGSVSKADYFALRHGFLTVHFDTDSNYDFHKFLRRSIDHDFKAVARIGIWVWTYAVMFIFLNAHGFLNHYWAPMIPLAILLIVGMKLEVIITQMCLKGSQEVIVVPGTVCVKPDNNFFWFGRPQLLHHLIHFILIQNSFHLAFFAWSWYTFGFHTCFHKETVEIVLGIVMGVIVQLLCAYVTLPLYTLVTQMGSSMKESIFADCVIQGLRNWRRTAKKRLAEKQKSSRSSTTSTLTPTSTPSTPSREPLTPLNREEPSTSNMRSPNPPPKFKYPSGRLELLEVQKVVEEIIQCGTNSSRYNGEVSFRLWKRQGYEPSTRGRR
ncbi:MLO-like protein 12 [Asparagus officinalis]|uniref:MLO-like protein 12 n=1 Tax=Asparagus officinalis TaxID=4686 RepID=UPI00098E3B00|nr:MLO-like protein 12 [Asparagus officinalis]